LVNSKIISVLKSTIPFIYLSLVLIFLLSVFQLSQMSYFTDSEIFAMSSTRFLFDRIPETSGTFLKPLFHLILYPVYSLSKTNLDVYVYTRVLCAFCVLFCIYFLIRIFKSLEPNQLNILLFTILSLICSYQFIIWYPTYRSDSFAAPFLLAAFYYILNYSEFSQTKKIFFFQFLAFLVTPKSILLIFIQIILLLFLERRRFSIKKALFLPIMIGVLFLTVLLLDNFYFQLFKYSRQYFLSLSHLGNLFAFNKDSFSHLFMFLKDDYIFVILFVLCLITLTWNFKANQKTRLLVIYGFLSLLLLILYPDKLPFFISSFLPIFAIIIYSALSRLSILYPRLMSLTLLCVFTPILIYNHLQARNFIIKSFNNHNQYKLIKQMESSIVRPLNYYDALGILPLKNPLLGFLGPGQEEINKLTFERIKMKSPDAILGSGRLISMSQDFKNWIFENYILTPNGIFIRKNLMEDPQFKIFLNWGPYFRGINFIQSFQFNPKINYRLKELTP